MLRARSGLSIAVSLLLVPLTGVALLAACKSSTADTAQSVVPDGAAAPQAFKFENPGGMWMPRQMNHPVHAAALQAMGVSIPASKPWQN